MLVLALLACGDDGASTDAGVDMWVDARPKDAGASDVSADRPPHTDDDAGLGCTDGGNCDAGRSGGCADGELGGDETDVDCGGSCGPCGPGEQCLDDADCASGLCEMERCVAAAVCGDGARQEAEACEGSDLGGATCEDLGFAAGRLGCTDECKLDTSGCEDPTFQQVATGLGFSCGLRSDGTVACWGAIDSPEGHFESVAAGNHACGIRPDQSLYCWRRATSDYFWPSGRFVAVDLTKRYACGIREDGTLACFTSGGSKWAPAGEFVQVATGSMDFGCGRHAIGTVTCWQDGSVIDAPLDSDFIHITAGREVACGVHSDFTVECWTAPTLRSHPLTDGLHRSFRMVELAFGQQYIHNGWGLRPDGRTSVFDGWRDMGESKLPLPESGTELTQLDHFMIQASRRGSPAFAHGCGVGPDGTVLCWGNNDWGQTTLPTFERYTVVSAHRYGCGIRRDDGTVDCWGGRRRDIGVAGDVPDGELTDVAVGDGARSEESACGVRGDGRVLCWGDELPESPPDAAFVQIAVGRNHACGLLDSGTVACWGQDSHGESDPPRGVMFSEVRAAGDHSCGLTTDGHVLCWGASPFARTLDDARYTQISIRGATPLVRGGGGGCALRDDGATVCWGSSEPVVVDSGPSVEVAAFDDGYCVRRPDGTVDCAPDAPQPSDEIVFDSLADEGGHPCGLRPGGRIYCWGEFRWGI